MTSPVGSPPPRALIVLIAAIVLAGIPVAVVSGFGVLVYPPYAGIGALLALRRHRNPIGWLLIALSWTFLFAFQPTTATAAALQAGIAPPLEIIMAWSSAWLPTSGFLLLLVIMIIFPAGRMPKDKWRWPAIAAIMAAASAVILAALVPTFKVTVDGQAITLPNQFTFLPDDSPWDWLTEAFPYPVFVGLLIAGAGSMLVRAGRATGPERQQLRWVVAAFAALACAIPFGFAVLIVFGDRAADVAWLPALASFTLPPIAIGIAILRYRLYDIDRIISRTIAYGLVSAIVAVVFGGVVVFLSTALSSLAEGQTVAVAASTLAAFAVFQPVLRRVRRGVDMRFNRARYDAERTVADFSARLRDEVDIATVARDLDTTVQGAVKPASLRLWIREARS
jgi:hypothetical protein